MEQEHKIPLVTIDDRVIMVTQEQYDNYYKTLEKMYEACKPKISNTEGKTVIYGTKGEWEDSNELKQWIDGTTSKEN